MASNRVLNFIVEEITTNYVPTTNNPSDPPLCEVHLYFNRRFQSRLPGSSRVVQDYTVCDGPLPPIRIPLWALSCPMLCNWHDLLNTLSSFSLDWQLLHFLIRHLRQASLCLSGGGHAGFRLVACVEILTVNEIDEEIDIENSENRLLVMKKLVSKMVVDKLSRRNNSVKTSLEDPCAVCLEEFSSSDSGGEELPITLPCSHVFHHSCLCRWLEQKNSCPMCRCGIHAHDLDVDDLHQDFRLPC